MIVRNVGVGRVGVCNTHPHPLCMMCSCDIEDCENGWVMVCTLRWCQKHYRSEVLGDSAGRVFRFPKKPWTCVHPRERSVNMGWFPVWMLLSCHKSHRFHRRIMSRQNLINPCQVRNSEGDGSESRSLSLFWWLLSSNFVYYESLKRELKWLLRPPLLIFI